MEKRGDLELDDVLCNRGSVRFWLHFGATFGTCATLILCLEMEANNSDSLSCFQWPGRRVYMLLCPKLHANSLHKRNINLVNIFARSLCKFIRIYSSFWLPFYYGGHGS